MNKKNTVVFILGWPYVPFSQDVSCPGFLICIKCPSFGFVFIFAEGNGWKIIWPIVCIIHNRPIVACKKAGSTENGQSIANTTTF